MSNTLTLTEDNVAVLIATWTGLELWRAPTEAGTYTLVAAIPYVPAQTTYVYTDAGGSSGDWYKIRRYAPGPVYDTWSASWPVVRIGSTALMVPLLTVADNPSIRAAISSDMSATDLSDFIISTSYRLASTQVFQIDPLAATWPSDSEEAARVHDAAILFAAAYLMRHTKRIISEEFVGYEYRVQQDPDLQGRADDLREMAQELLLMNLGKLIDLMRPSAMTLAAGGRGDISDDRFGAAISTVPFTDVMV